MGMIGHRVWANNTCFSIAKWNIIHMEKKYVAQN